MITTCVKQYTDYMNREITSAPWILTRQGNHVIVHVSRLVSCIMYGYSIIITGSVSAHIRTESPGMWDIGYRSSVQYMMAQLYHYSDVKMGPMVPIVYLTVDSGADQRKHQNSASLAFVRGIHRWPVNSPHKWPVTRKKFPFDDVIILEAHTTVFSHADLRFQHTKHITSHNTCTSSCHAYSCDVKYFLCL